MRSSPYGDVTHGQTSNTFVLEAFGERLEIAVATTRACGSCTTTSGRARRKPSAGSRSMAARARIARWHAKGAITAFVHGKALISSGDATPPTAAGLPEPCKRGDPRASRHHRDPRRPGERRTPPLRVWLHALDEMKVNGGAHRHHDPPEPRCARASCTQKGSSSPKTTSMSPRRKAARITSYSSTWYVTATARARAGDAEFLSVLLPKAGQDQPALPRATWNRRRCRGVELRFPTSSRTVAGFALPGVTGTVSLERSPPTADLRGGLRQNEQPPLLAAFRRTNARAEARCWRRLRSR